MAEITQIPQLLREAVAQHRAGKLDQAQLLYREILAINPGHADAMQLLGVIATDRDDIPAALKLIGAAIQIAPNIASWHNNLGTALRRAGRHEEALESFHRALELDPNSAVIHFNLANALGQLGRIDQSVASYRRAIELAPGNATMIQSLSEALYEQGETAAAIDTSERAIGWLSAGNVRTRARLFNATMAPLIYESRDEVDRYRQRTIQRVKQLRAEGVRYSLTQPPPTMFRLAYQGKNDCEILSNYASLMSPPEIPAPCGSGRANGRIRVGFISTYFRNHTVGRLTITLIERISRARFEIVILSVGDHQGAIANRYRAAANRFVVVPNDLGAAREIIAEQNLDVLFYADIGMDQLTYAMAFSRLAPVQCVTWGHSVTSGVGAIDYYISSEEFDDESAQAHYSEKLIRLPSSAIGYERPQPHQPKKRSDFGLPEDAHLYGCLQTLFKFHPDFDELIAKVLRRDPKGWLLLVEGRVGRWKDLLMARLARTMGDVIDRTRWLPRLSGEDFFAITALCDVMLDPPHFGGCTTSSEAFAFGVPVVTLPAPLLRGRFTQGFCRKMQIDDCIVVTSEQYVDLAVELGTNRDRRQSVSQKILSRCDVLYDNRVGVRALEDFLASAIEK